MEGQSAKPRPVSDKADFWIHQLKANKKILICCKRHLQPSKIFELTVSMLTGRHTATSYYATCSIRTIMTVFTYLAWPLVTQLSWFQRWHVM
jgi:hypothetical protein